MKLDVLSSPEAAARAAASRIAAAARDAVRRRGRFVLALSGGHTPWQMLDALAAEDVPWDGMVVAQVDERVAPPDHPDRNLVHLREHLVGPTPLAESQILAMPVDEDDLDAAARRYAEALAERAGSPPVLDLVHLGLGPDGHTASLVPDDAVLGVDDRDVAPTAGSYQGRCRLTLTYPLLNRARRILWLATGGEKATAALQLWRGNRQLPAGRVARRAALLVADRAAAASIPAPRERVVLAVDVGGSHVKIRRSGDEEVRKRPTGPDATAQQVVDSVRSLGTDWEYDVVSLGYPGPVARGRPVCEPRNLGSGWVGFDFEAAFGRPVRVINDAAMQALGSYDGGRMLFLGLGTGLGSALVVDGELEPLELGHLPYHKGSTFEDWVGERGLERLGKKRWREAVADVVERLCAALQPDYVVIGGGNVKKLKELPERARAGSNENAFLGGFRLWQGEEDDGF
jgi:polyphosphate glucokinase